MTMSTPPTSAKLLRHTLLSLSIASLVLIAAVLPAEFGLDPTGLGARLGLTVLHTDPDTQQAAVETGLVRRNAAWKENTLTLNLAPGQGAELKAMMQAGESFAFHWQTDGAPVSFDMHGEKPDAAADEFTSYWEEQARSQGSGQFIAPFDGSHGWYWQNNGSQPVTVQLRVAGFYRSVYMP